MNAIYCFVFEPGMNSAQPDSWYCILLPRRAQSIAKGRRYLRHPPGRSLVFETKPAPSAIPSNISDFLAVSNDMTVTFPREQRNIASHDMVEVSVVLAEALLLEKEGTTLLKRHQQLLQHRAAGSSRQGGDNANASSGDPISSALSTATRTTLDAVAGGTAESTAASDAEMVRRCWNDEKAAENQRRVDILSRSLEASDIHDLQILRRFLQRQVDDAARAGLRGKRPRSRGERSGAGRSSPELKKGVVCRSKTAIIVLLLLFLVVLFGTFRMLQFRQSLLSCHLFYC